MTDGTVAKNLEAYFWEPIDVELLSHARARSESSNSEIHPEPLQEIVRRRVMLRGRMTGSAHAFAETVMAIEGLTPDLQRSLVEERIGIGDLLRARKLETYRELVSVERRQPANGRTVWESSQLGAS